MEMDVLNIQKVIWRWKWLIITPVVLTLVVLGIRSFFANARYTADVTIQVSTPDSEDVYLTTDVPPWRSDRDEVTIVTNNFIEAVSYAIVEQRTLDNLGIPTADYEVSVVAETGSDLVIITVEAQTPELAAEIANEHALVAIAHYGELRGLPSASALAYFQTELDKANTDLEEVEAQLAAFQTENNVVNLTSEIELQQRLLTELETSRDRILVQSITEEFAPSAEEVIVDVDLNYQIELLRIDLQAKQLEIDQIKLERDSTIAQNNVVVATASDDSTTTSTTNVTQSAQINRYNQQILESEKELGDLQLSLLDLEKEQLEAVKDQSQSDLVTNRDQLIENIDALILEQRDRLNTISALEPTYNELNASVARIQETRDFLVSKQEETELQRSFSELVSFLQVIEQAAVPQDAESNPIRTLFLGLVGSLGLGILMAFFSDYLFGDDEDESFVSAPPAPVATSAATDDVAAA